MCKEWLQFTENQGPNTGQAATVITGHGKMDWFKIGKGVYKGVYCYSAYLTSMQSFLFVCLFV